MMKIRKNIENWLLEKTRSNYFQQIINVGYWDFYLDFSQPEADPLKPLLFVPGDKQYQICFSGNDFTGYEKELVYSRRLAYTPFYVHYFLLAGIPVKIIDFYRLSSPDTLFRLFLFDNQHLPEKVYISFSALHEDESPGHRENNSIKISASGTIKQNTNQIEVSPEWTADGMFAVSMSKNRDVPDNLDINEIYSLLLTQDSVCNEQNLTNYVTIGNTSTHNEIESYWFMQNLISPDWQIAIDHDHFAYFSPWIKDLSDILGHALVREQLDRFFSANAGTEDYKYDHRLAYVQFCLTGNLPDLEGESGDHFVSITNLQKNKKNVFTGRPVYELGFLAYFTETVPDQLVPDLLNDWWHLYSQPAFSRKLAYECRENSESILILVLLAYRYKLYWAGQLAEVWRQAGPNPFFLLILKIKQAINVRRSRAGELTMEPGVGWSHNVQQIQFIDSTGTIKYTRYSNKVFTRYEDSLQHVFRIDRPVIVKVSASGKRISVLPSLRTKSGEYGTLNPVTLQVQDYELAIPFMWAKFEFLFAGIRFRVLAKKNRFQITAVRQGKVTDFVLNGVRNDFGTNNKKLAYYSPADNQLETNIFIYRQGAGCKNLILAGWAVNRYGVLVDNINYQSAKRVHHLAATNSGDFEVTMAGEKDIKKVIVSFRHHKEERIIDTIVDRNIRKLLALDPGTAQGKIILQIEPGISEKLPAILAGFYAEFAYYPEYYIAQSPLRSSSANDLVIKFTKEKPEKISDESGKYIILSAHEPGKSMNQLIQSIKSCKN